MPGAHLLKPAGGIHPDHGSWLQHLALMQPQTHEVSSTVGGGTDQNPTVWQSIMYLHPRQERPRINCKAETLSLTSNTHRFTYRNKNAAWILIPGHLWDTPTTSNWLFCLIGCHWDMWLGGKIPALSTILNHLPRQSSRVNSHAPNLQYSTRAGKQAVC
jgi:hypothetical protein